MASKTMALENGQLRHTQPWTKECQEGSWECFLYSLPDSQGTGMAPGVLTEALRMHSIQQALYKSGLDVNTNPGKCPTISIFSSGYL